MGGFDWRGDLSDDCYLRLPDYAAHAENMGGEPGSWYCSVSETPRGGELNGRCIFHSTDADVVPLTGETARWLCEAVIAAARAGVWREPPKWAELYPPTREG